MSQDLPTTESHKVSIWQRLTGNWKPLIEQPVSESDLDSTMHQAALPVLGYYLMLTFAAVIATLGLLSNSAPTIIGAMIIAPLMSPIISLSYGIVVVDWQLINRSIVMLLTGVVLVLLLAFAMTQILGLRIAGSEILRRSHPTLLDLGVAIAAGGAAAFAFTRRSIMNAIAGVAIAVALVPPLAVCGIGLSQGLYVSADVGQSLSEIGLYSGGDSIAKGAFLLFVTNLAGIIVTAGVVFVAHGYGQLDKSILGLGLVAVASIALFYPLGVSLYKLHVKSMTLSLIVASEKKMPKLYSGPERIESVNVVYKGDRLHVNLDILGNEANLNHIQEKVDLFQQSLSRLLQEPVVVEVDIIPVKIRHFVSGGGAQTNVVKLSDGQAKGLEALQVDKLKK